MRVWLAALACAVAATSFTTAARADTASTIDPNCSVANVPSSTVTEPRVPASVALEPRVEPTTIVVARDGFVRRQFTGLDEGTYRILRAQYFVQQHDLLKAAAEYRLAATTPPAEGNQPSYHDLVTRLPLSVVLYRAGRIAEAQSEWRTMLGGARKYQYPMLPQPPSIELLIQRRLNLLAEREIPDGLPDYVENGAGRHIMRGLIASKQQRYDAAAVEWRCAATASPRFELPHLLLGCAAALRGDKDIAKQEWIATLEGVQHGPGDMLSITGWQYDAMEALLRYT